MREPVPVADHLLEHTLYGIPIRRLLEAMGVPLLPGLVLYAGQPLLGLSFPVIASVALGGVLIGLYVYRRTPPGQRPLAWTLARLRYATQPTTYVWDPQAATVRPATATLPIQDEWLTMDVDSDSHTNAIDNTTGPPADTADPSPPHHQKQILDRHA